MMHYVYILIVIITMPYFYGNILYPIGNASKKYFLSSRALDYMKGAILGWLVLPLSVLGSIFGLFYLIHLLELEFWVRALAILLSLVYIIFLLSKWNKK